MTKTEHLQFLVLMIPTFLILAAAAVSMADLELPSPEPTYMVAADPLGFGYADLDGPRPVRAPQPAAQERAGRKGK